jgi:hypothetical protein
MAKQRNEIWCGIYSSEKLRRLELSKLIDELTVGDLYWNENLDAIEYA